MPTPLNNIGHSIPLWPPAVALPKIQTTMDYEQGGGAPFPLGIDALDISKWEFHKDS